MRYPCPTKNCLGTFKRKKDGMCGKCVTRRYREKYPCKSSYTALKHNARRRGIPFLLTFGYWTKFCDETDYLKLRGSFGKDMTVDRINPLKPYEDGNIQMLTREENVKKQRADAALILAAGGVPWDAKNFVDTGIKAPF